MLCSSRLYLNSIAKDKIAAIGLALFKPAMSGAEPCIGSYIPAPVSFNDAEGNMPIEPTNCAAASDSISPNKLPLDMTSN